MFIDTHAHLDPRHLREPLDELLDRAAGAGVSQLIAVGCGLEASESAVRMASEHHGHIFAVVGVHPHDSGDMSALEFDAIAGLAELPEVVAIGETGLDYHYDHSPRQVQRDVFARFLKLSASLEKPVVVHTREAEDDTVSILREHAPLVASGQLHCFTGTMDLAEVAMDLGLFVSFSGALTFANAGRLRAIARAIPLEKILIETDCPYMTPAPFRGSRNEPMLVPVVAGTLAAEKDVSISKVAEVTSRSARSLFGLPERTVEPPLVFPAGADLLVAPGPDATPERLIPMARRYPKKRIRRVLPLLVDGAHPSATEIEAVRRLAEEMGLPFFQNTVD